MIELSQRQLDIVKIIKESGPITAEEIAEEFKLSKATIRPDLTLLTRSGTISAKPRVGYYYNQSRDILDSTIGNVLNSLTVADWMGVPTVISPDITVYNAIVELFMRDVGSLFVYDEINGLQGIISRKDLLKASIGGNDLNSMPIAMIMTRMPNLVTVYETDSLYHAAKKMDVHEIDSLPVVEHMSGDRTGLKVIGRITKTSVVKAFVNLGM